MNSIAEHPDVKSGIDLFCAWVDSQMAYTGLPGLAAGVVYDQELIWSKGFGYADSAKGICVTPKTLFRIASITKLFTSTAIMILRDAGKLRLDDAVQKYIPWFKIQNTYPDAPEITIQHLLTHTSGLPREADFPYWTTANFPDIEEIRNTICNQKTILPSETRWKYSNLALALAGEVIATVSKMDYSDFIEQNVLRPLRMDDTFVRTLPHVHPFLAVGYGRRMPDLSRSIRPFGDCKGISAAANIASNVEDLAKFAMLQFRDAGAGGSQILKGSTLREMHRVHWLDANWQQGWGLGFSIVRMDNKTYVGHGGSLMGYRTQLLLSPEEKTAAIILTNADDGEPSKYIEKAFKWICSAVVRISKPSTGKAEINPDWEKLVGLYRNPWGDTQIMLLNNDLVAIDPSLPDPSADIARLIPVSNGIFRIEQPSGYGSHNEMAVFEMNPDGRVAALKIGVDYSYPVEKW